MNDVANLLFIILDTHTATLASAFYYDDWSEMYLQQTTNVVEGRQKVPNIHIVVGNLHIA